MSDFRFTELKCRRCGGQLKSGDGGIYECLCCGKTYEKASTEDFSSEIRDMLDEKNREKIANLRQLLWKETHEEFVSNREVERLSGDILRYLPEDFYANFYLSTCSKTKSALGDFLLKTDVGAHYDDIPELLGFLLKGLKSEWVMPVGNLIERAYKNSDMKLYNKYRTEFEEVNAGIDDGVFEPSLPRDVFVAYSSTDMPEIQRLVDVLEGEDLTCFVAARNLRHGSGAVDNYENAIQTAIEHCSVLVFVSTQSSRSIHCDAYKELNYIEAHAKDMPRVEYILENYSGRATERYFKKFFSGLEYCTSAQQTAERVCGYLMQAAEDVKSEKEAHISPKQEDKTAREEERKSSQEKGSPEQNGVFNIGKFTNFGSGYVTFGAFPKSKKAENVVIGEEVDRERGYYAGSDNALYVRHKDAYYKVEPIKWKILRQNDGEFFLVADAILDAQRFDNDSNNYADSRIRQWLNGEFYKTAFTAAQQDIILTTDVENGLAGTCDDYNKNVCVDTADKVFLLSRAEARKYFDDNAGRQRIPTDYATANGAYQYEGSNAEFKKNGIGCGWWWLRSPYSSNSYHSYNVGRHGYANGHSEVYSSNFGVVPAIIVKP